MSARLLISAALIALGLLVAAAARYGFADMAEREMARSSATQVSAADEAALARLKEVKEVCRRASRGYGLVKDVGGFVSVGELCSTVGAPFGRLAYAYVSNIDGLPAVSRSDRVSNIRENCYGILDQVEELGEGFAKASGAKWCEKAIGMIEEARF